MSAPQFRSPAGGGLGNRLGGSLGGAGGARERLRELLGLSGPEDPVPRPRVFLIMGLLLLVLASFEVSFFTRFDGFPFFSAVPDLLLITVAGFAFFAGARAGAVAGIAAGFLKEALGGVGFPLSVPVFFLCGYLVGRLNLTLPVRSFRAYFISFACLLPVRGALTMLSAAFFGGFSFFDVLLRSVLPEAVLTTVFAVLLYPLLRRAAVGRVRPDT